ncbi:uncharacterized protein [Bemisia tabaci]|uniref:uncharacterized protein isoform X2 n=1 Tax=Bemisia tabaci TaxID=7038 RepID=UPI003B27C701
METRSLYMCFLFSALTSVYAIALTKVVQTPRSNSIASGNVEYSYVSNNQVNISNVWTLPEEGYPVFYRYFRDRVTWFEADAVCQFHHAQLVTVDSNIQFDAVRAFLKELDVSNNVWIGLRQAKPYGEFVWTDFKPLTNQEHWHEPITQSESTVCVASDPAADFRWHGFNCGGPEVASFICEIQVPDWAQRDGCLPTALPSLTVTYLPEQSAVELISDCGLDGSRRVICQGHRSREAVMKELSCESVTESPIDENAITAESEQTRHRRDTVQPSEATTVLAATILSVSTLSPSTKAATPKPTTRAGVTVKATELAQTNAKSPTAAAATVMTTTTATTTTTASATTAATLAHQKSVTMSATSGAPTVNRETTKSEKPSEATRTKAIDFSGSLDSTEDGHESSEAPQEMSIAEEPIKLRAQEVSPSLDLSEDQLKMENKSVEMDSPNSNSVQKVTESFTVLKGGSYWPTGDDQRSSIASEESIEDQRNLKAPIKNANNTTQEAANTTSRAATPKPSTTKGPHPDEIERRKAAILAHISATLPPKELKLAPWNPLPSVQEVESKTPILSTPSHLKEESHEIFAEKTSKKVKKTILGSKLNSFDATTPPPRHENSVQTTVSKYICKNLPPVLLYSKNSNEPEQVLTSGSIETYTTPEEHGKKLKNKLKLAQTKSHVETTSMRTETEGATNVAASTAKLETTQKVNTITTSSVPEVDPKTTVVFSSDAEVLNSMEMTTKLVVKDQLKLEATSTEPSMAAPTTERHHRGFLESTDDVPERPNRGRLLIHPQHHSFYPYFLNRVLG